MSKSFIVYLYHILEECHYINSEIEKGITEDDFYCDEKLKRAIVRSLEIIGEATKNIPSDIKHKWTKTQWRNMAGMRDKLIHDYMGIDYFIVWDVAKHIIPELTEQIECIIEEEKRSI